MEFFFSGTKNGDAGIYGFFSAHEFIKLSVTEIEEALKSFYTIFMFSVA